MSKATWIRKQIEKMLFEANEIVIVNPKGSPPQLSCVDFLVFNGGNKYALKIKANKPLSSYEERCLKTLSKELGFIPIYATKMGNILVFIDLRTKEPVDLFKKP